MNKFAKYLKTVREHTGYTLAHAAESIGVSLEELKRWESGFDVPFLTDLPRIARAYRKIPLEVQAVFFMHRFEMNR